MEMKTTLTVNGARKYNDEIEGQAYDFTKVRVVMPLPETSENEVGINQVEMPWGNHKNHAKFPTDPSLYPMKVEATLSLTSKGYEIKNITFPATVKASA